MSLLNEEQASLLHQARSGGLKAKQHLVGFRNRFTPYGAEPALCSEAAYFLPKLSGNA